MTQAIYEGRAAALARLTEEASRQGASGVAGVTGELRSFSGSTEFLFVGSASTPGCRPRDCSPALATHRNYFVTWTRAMSRSSMCSAISLIPSARAAGTRLVENPLARGEIREFSDVFNHTRHAALDRVAGEARRGRANAVVGIRTTILALGRYARDDDGRHRCLQPRPSCVGDCH